MARRRRRKKRSLAAAVVVLCLAVAYPLYGQLDSQEEGDLSAASAEAYREWSSLEVHFLDVGQGDATLILCGDNAMLIDAGNNSWGDEVRDYLEYQGVESLNYVIGTHPDADHIGGLDVVLEAFDCGTVIMPDYEKDTQTYEDVLAAMDQKGYELTLPEVGTVCQLGEAAFTIVAPCVEYGDNANDYSVGICWSMEKTVFCSQATRRRTQRTICLAAELICLRMYLRRLIMEAAQPIRKLFWSR